MSEPEQPEVEAKPDAPPNAPTATDDEIDQAFDFDSGGDRLRFRCKWAAAGVALGTVLPYEVVAGSPQYIWHLADELPPAGLVAALAPALAGLVAALAGWRAQRPASAAWIVLGALIGMRLVIDIGADAAAWGALGMPQSFGARQGWALLALSLTAAGATLTFKPHARRVGHILLIAGVAVAAAFFLWPGRGEAPIRTVVRAASTLGDLPDWRFRLGIVVIGTMVLWPALVPIAGLLHLKLPARDNHPIVALVALYGLPVLIAMMVFRGMSGGADGWSIFTAGGTIALLAATVALMASAIEVAAEATFAPPPDVEPPAGWPPLKTASVTAVALAVVVIAQSLLARPPAKGIDWQLGERTPAADALFTDALPAWNRARLSWDRQAKGDSGAAALLRVRKAARDVVAAAEAIDPGLAEALDAMTRAARDLHVAGRTWYRVVDRVNEASRTAGLPYYLDPSIFTWQTPDGPGRHFRMRTYAVEKVRRFAVEGDAFATLHVRRIDTPDSSSRLLGFSRDVQRFALVDLSDAADFEVSLVEGALRTPPVCDTDYPPDASPGMHRCGEKLAELVQALPDGLAPAIVAITDRHELQHQIDGPHLPLSSAVLTRLSGNTGPLAERINRELSAYVAEMTVEDAPPLLGLIHLTRFALHGRGYLFHVAMIALETMVDRPLDDGYGGADHQAVSDAFAELAGLPEDTLRQRAADAWAALFEEPLATVSIPAE